MAIFAEMNGFIEQLKALLASELPGSEAQYKMAPEIRLGEDHLRYKNAAVLILLYQKNGQIFTVLMKRPQYQGTHSNQIRLEL